MRVLREYIKYYHENFDLWTEDNYQQSKAKTDNKLAKGNINSIPHFQFSIFET